MSFTLMDSSSENFEFQANVWHWKTALEIIKSFDILSESKIKQMSYNATGVKLEKDEAHIIGEKVRDEILPKLTPNKRILPICPSRTRPTTELSTATRTNNGKIIRRITNG